MVESKRINIRLSETEFEKVKLSAEVLGISVGRYSKQLILKSPLVAPKFSAKVQQEYFRQLSGIANNLNQLTRLANEIGIDFLDDRELQNLRNEVNKLWQQLEK